MALSDAADPSSELPFRLQQSFKNTPVLVLLFKPLQSHFNAACSCSMQLEGKIEPILSVYEECGNKKEVGGETSCCTDILKIFMLQTGTRKWVL